MSELTPKQQSIIDQQQIEQENQQQEQILEKAPQNQSLQRFTNEQNNEKQYQKEKHKMEGQMEIQPEIQISKNQKEIEKQQKDSLLQQNLLTNHIQPQTIQSTKQMSKQMEIQHQPQRKNPTLFQFSPSKANKRVAQIIDLDQKQLQPSNVNAPKKTSLNKNCLSGVNKKQSYVNSLQVQLRKVKQSFHNLQQQKQNLQNTNKASKEASKKLRFEVLTLKKEAIKSQQQKQKLTQQIQDLKLNCNLLNQKLQAYKQVGDINLLKNKIEQLQLMVKLQNDQLSLKKHMIDQKQQVKESFKNKLEIMKQVQKITFQNRLLMEKNEKLQIHQQKSLVEILTLTSQLNNYKENFQKEMQNSQQLAQKVKKLQEKLKQTELNYSVKLKQVQQKLIQALNMNIDPQNQSREELIPPTKYGVKILSIKEQKELLLRQYIEIQMQNKKMKQSLANLKQKYFNSVKQLKNISNSYVGKKDHTELWNKYTKLRKCLQNSIKNEEVLNEQVRVLQLALKNSPKQANLSSINISQKMSKKIVNSLNILLEQKQNPVHEIQFLIQSSKKSNQQLKYLKASLNDKQKLSQLQNQVQKKQNQLILARNQNKRYQNVLQFYQKDLKFKNTQIQNLKYENEILNKKLQKAIKKNEGVELSSSQIQELRMIKNMNELGQIKILDLLNKNHYLKKQINSWKELYQTLKQQYEEFMKKQPLKIVQNNKQLLMQEEGQLTEFICQKCKKTGEDINSSQPFGKVEKSDQILQTDGLAQLYYKQMKQLLIILRKFPKIVDNVTSSLEGEKINLLQIKRKYDQQNKTFKLKYKKLEEEKQQNQEWRLKQKLQIREQFQQIRELIINNRLMNAIRKAKSLIQYYQKQQEGQEQENKQGQNNINNQQNQLNQESEQGQNQNDSGQPQNQKKNMQVEQQKEK